MKGTWRNTNPALMYFAIPALASSPVTPIAGPLVALVVILYIGAPLYALAFQTQHARLKGVALVSLDVVQQMDPEAARALAGASTQLAQLGFTIGTPVRVPTSKRATGFVIVGEAPNGDVAESYVLVRRADESVTRHGWTNFRSATRTADRTVTSNSSTRSAIPPRNGYNGFSAPGVKDLARLYRLHELRVEDAGGRRRGAPPIGDHAAFIERENARATDNMVERGYSWRAGKDGETLRLTPKGAFLIAWRQLPPLSALAETKARRGLAALEARLPREAPLARSA